MVDERLHTLLTVTAVVLTLAWVGWAGYRQFVVERAPGDLAYAAAERRFEDRDYQRALAEFDEALAADPDHLDALRGRARTLMQLGRHAEALAAYGEVLARAPDLAVAYANRGILQDRMGRYRAALGDYDRALALDPGLAEGPGLMTRFFRLQDTPPPTIASRARYLREQLAQPESERLLRLPERDAEQRPYKL